MGVGGEANAADMAPDSKPPFILSDLKKAIPRHCFRRSLIHSFFYAGRDCAAAIAISYAAVNSFDLLPSCISPGAWLAAWLLQGFFMVGLWIIAHECGHHAFSDYKYLDDAVGFIIHSSFLVPYFSWKISHRLHHTNSGSIIDDQTFIPRLRQSLPSYQRIVLTHPVGRVFFILSSAVAGWPLYLACNLTGKSYERWACHFDPYSPMYNHRERVLIIASDAGVVTCAYLLYRVAAAKGVEFLFRIYGAPLLVVHATTILIIFLQHTHPSLPRYDASEWEWLRGALSTVDRDYGILNRVFHHIGDTHVIHHLFPSIPHFHAVEATEAVKPILGPYYRYDGTVIFKALWREVSNCVFVEKSQTNGVFWYRKLE